MLFFGFRCTKQNIKLQIFVFVFHFMPKNSHKFTLKLMNKTRKKGKMSIITQKNV